MLRLRNCDGKESKCHGHTVFIDNLRSRAVRIHLNCLSVVCESVRELKVATRSWNSAGECDKPGRVLT